MTVPIYLQMFCSVWSLFNRLAEKHFLMFSALKDGWSINVFYYLREMISFEEGQGGHYFLAAYQRILEGILSRLGKESNWTEE